MHGNGAARGRTVTGNQRVQGIAKAVEQVEVAEQAEAAVEEEAVADGDRIVKKTNIELRIMNVEPAYRQAGVEV